MTSNDPVTDDATWEFQLVGLLSGLDVARGRLTSVDARADPRDLLAAVDALLVEIGTFAHTNLEATEELNEVFEWATETRTAIRTVAKRMSPSVWGSFGGLFGRTKTAEVSDVQEDFQHVLQGVLVVASSFFDLFRTRFQTEQAVRTWSETADGFVGELAMGLRPWIG